MVENGTNYTTALQLYDAAGVAQNALRTEIDGAGTAAEPPLSAATREPKSPPLP